MDPVTATVLAVAGTLVSGGGQFIAAQNNATIQEFSAEVADRNAKQAQTTAAVQQQEQDIKNRALLGAQFAQQAGSGIDVGKGSAVDVRMNARELARMDALNIHQAGEINAANYKTQAAGFRMQADADQSAGAFGLVSSFINAGSIVAKARPTAAKNYYPPVPTARPTILK